MIEAGGETVAIEPDGDDDGDGVVAIEPPTDDADGRVLGRPIRATTPIGRGGRPHLSILWIHQRKGVVRS